MEETHGVIDAAQQTGDVSVSPGAGRGVNKWRRSTHSITSVHPRMAAAQGPVDPSSPEQVSHFPGGRAPSLVPGRHSQPETNTSKSDAESFKCAKEQEELAVWRGTGEENGGVRAPRLGPRAC